VITRIRQSCLAAAVSAACFGFATAGADASVIQFMHEGVGSGSLEGQGFQSAAFVITAYGNTDDRVNITAGWAIQHTSASIFIDGLGTFDFLVPTRSFVNHNAGLVGFSRSINGGTGGNDLFNGPADAAFNSWDMLSSIGPVAGTGSLIQWGGDIQTTGGTLLFDTGIIPATFTATLIPAPGALALLGIAGLTARRRRSM